MLNPTPFPRHRTINEWIVIETKLSLPPKPINIPIRNRLGVNTTRPNQLLLPFLELITIGNIPIDITVPTIR